MDIKEPMKAPEVRRLAQQLLEKARFRVTGHAHDELANDDMDLADVQNVLRGGRLARDKGVSFERGAWRYRIETTRMAVVIEFSDDYTRFTVVTAFRLGTRR